jgi:hypothetical protein
VSPCERLRADAAGLAALRPEDPERVSAWSHARQCPGCERALRQAERLQRMVGAWEPPPLPPGALGQAARAIDDELRLEAWRRGAAAAAAICAAFAGIVLLARARSESGLDRGVAAGLCLGAVGFAVEARQMPIFSVVGAVVMGVVAAALTGEPGPFASALGAECLATELAAAAVAVGAVWLVLRRGTTSPARIALAAAAGAGALAGDAALQLTCPARAAVPHLVVFHVGGVIAAAAIAALLWRKGLARGAAA